MGSRHLIPKYGHLEGCALHFVNFSGKTLRECCGEYSAWIDSRRENDVLPFAKAWKSQELNAAVNSGGPLLNFGTHDYLGLSNHTAVLNAAQEAVAHYGIHTASSPTLNGRTDLCEILENRISRLLDLETAVLFPTGWMAGFGVLAGLTNARDTIVMDKLAHNCLQLGAGNATKKILKFNHNNLNHLERILKDCREKDPENGLFVVTETLYSMNADAPDLPALLQLIDRYECILVLDVAHDLAANGARGLGLLETINLKGRENVVIMGAFSKTLGANGGFVAGPRVIRNQMMFGCPSYIFSTALSALQCAVVLKAMDIAFSEEGDALRKRLRVLEQYGRKTVQAHGFKMDGVPCPIIPIIVGSEKKARLMSVEIQRQQLVTNPVEFPAVPRGRAIFRFLLQATHSEAEIDKAAVILSDARASCL